MPRYIFSNGTIRVEEGVYIPPTPRKLDSTSGVVIITKHDGTAEQKTNTLDKEKPTQSDHRTAQA
jgi:hypothetical protein